MSRPEWLQDRITYGDGSVDADVPEPDPLIIKRIAEGETSAINEYLRAVAASTRTPSSTARRQTSIRRDKALVEAAEIVCDLAAVRPGAACTLCIGKFVFNDTYTEYKFEHWDACPWKRSRLWMEQHAKEGQ